MPVIIMNANLQSISNNTDLMKPVLCAALSITEHSSTNGKRLSCTTALYAVKRVQIRNNSVSDVASRLL